MMLRIAILLVIALSFTKLMAQEPDLRAVEDTVKAGEAATDQPKRALLKWNEFDNKFFWFRVSAGIILDAGTYQQDDASKEQVGKLESDWQVRDFRVLLNGRIKSKRSITWSAGLMYDGANNTWLVRQTGVMIGIPELKGNLWIGRAKEGISLNMVMVGYAGWTMERSPMVVTTVPLLADGVKRLGYIPEKKLLYNLGWFTDMFSEGQSFSSYDNQFVARVGWLPIMQEKGKLLHVAVAGRYGTVNDRTLRLRSRPEFNIAPYFLDTGPFGARSSWLAQTEVYYRPGPLLIGIEYFVQWVDATEVGNPTFSGGDVSVCWLMTGETRKFNTAGGYFLQASPARPVFKGGLGALEAVLKLSYTDLDDGAVHGGRFWRLTPMVNWYLTDHFRLELNYGVGQLDDFGLIGTTQFFQSRLQFQF